MSSLGVVILAHEHLDRVICTAKTWLELDIPIEIHIDAKVSNAELAPLKDMTTQWRFLDLTPRLYCHWGRWSIVQATISATQRILEQNPMVSHVLLCSGSCLLLRPPSELVTFLERNKNIDFIESFRTDLVDPGPDGLSHERLTLRHPVSWKKFPKGFDLCVNMQRKFGLTRRLPDGFVPHIGSQWWCLTRKTLEYIFSDPDRNRIETLYKSSWIPDEGYFQTQARRWSTQISGQSLTYSNFDAQGKPRLFYDDHADALERSAVFLARKIWHGADQLYEKFPKICSDQSPDPTLLDFELQSKVRSRPIVQTVPSALPVKPSNPLYIFYGFHDLWPEFENWANSGGQRIVYNVLAPKASSRESVFPSPQRKPDPIRFLKDYKSKDQISGILIEAQDLNEFGYSWTFDPNISIEIISGSWLSQRPDPSTAAQWQRAELAWINELQKMSAQFNVTTIADAVARPKDVLHPIAKTLALQTNRCLPRLRVQSGMDETLQSLRIAGFAPKVFGPLRKTSTINGSGDTRTAVL